ncbi:MAG: hypothetical protein ACSW8I_04455 [bacterium]
MKTSIKSIIFASFLASLSPVWGQSYSAIVENTGNYSPPTIVRTCEDYAVSYVRENGQGYLYVTEVDDMATEGNPYLIYTDGKKYLLPGSNFEINDIQILQNVAFFCGRYLSNAVYGWVNIPFVSGANFHYYILPAITNLKQLVVYKDTASEKLVAIGENAPGPPFTFRKDVIVEVDNPTNTGFGLFYTLYTLPYTDNNNRECLYDIVLTQDSIVFIGYDTETRVSLYTRWADKSNISGTIQNRYDYTLPYDEICGDLLATVIDSTKWIAVVYVHAESGPRLTTRTRLIEIQGAHNMSYSQEYSIDEKMYPYEISYNSNHEILTVLQNCTGLPSDNKFRLLDPFPATSYIFNVLYDPNVEFTSLDQFDNSHYIATGINQSGTGKTWYMQDLNSPFTATSSCPYVSTESSSLLSSPSATYNPQIPSSLTNIHIYNFDPLVFYPVSPSLICNEPYYKKD